jgi:HK97 gp10 family phage protein
MIDGKFKIDLSPLDGLKSSISNKILRKAVTKASKVVRDAVKSNAQGIARYGYLAKSIGVKVKQYGDTAVAIVGPRSKWVKERGIKTKGKHKGEPRRFKPSLIAKLVEKGTKHSAAHPFLAPALASTKEHYFQLASESIKQSIADQLSKM